MSSLMMRTGSSSPASYLIGGLDAEDVGLLGNREVDRVHDWKADEADKAIKANRADRQERQAPIERR